MSRAAKSEIYKKLLGPKISPQKNYFWRKKNYPGGGRGKAKRRRGEKRRSFYNIIKKNSAIKEVTALGSVRVPLRFRFGYKKLLIRRLPLLVGNIVKKMILH